MRTEREKSLELYNIHHMGRDVRKPVFGGLRATKAQTSLYICAVCSAPLLFAYWKVSYTNLILAKFKFSSYIYVVSVAEQADLGMTISEIPKIY